MDNKKIREVILMITSGTIMSIIVGLLFFGRNIFIYRSPMFQFIIFGFIFALLIAIVKAYSLKTYILWSALVLIFIPFSTNSIQKFNMSFIVRDIFMGICIIASILIVSSIASKHFFKEKAYTEALTWITAIVVAYLLTSVALSIIFRPAPAHLVNNMLTQLKIGLLIGVGVSSGITIHQIAARKYKSIKETT